MRKSPRTAVSDGSLHEDLGLRLEAAALSLPPLRERVDDPALFAESLVDELNREANTRGVAVLHPTVTDAELKVLADGGIRGIRFTVFDPASAAVSIDMIAPLAKRVADLGWHLQIHMRGDQIFELLGSHRRTDTACAVKSSIGANAASAVAS